MLTPYAEFDPETGFFLPPEQPNATEPQSHITQNISENINRISELDDSSYDSQGSSSRMIAALLIALISIVFGIGIIYKKIK